MKLKMKEINEKQNKTASTTALQHLQTASKTTYNSYHLMTRADIESTGSICTHLTAHECTNSSVWQQ